MTAASGNGEDAKSEARNSKLETNSNDQNPKLTTNTEHFFTAFAYLILTP